MLTILYFIGLFIAFYKAYNSLGEEMYEDFPKIEATNQSFLVFMAVIFSLYSWVSVLIFSNRHKSFIKN